MIEFFLNIIFTLPLIEYGIHYAFHLTHNKTHRDHHIEFKNKTNDIELYPLLLIPTFYYLEYYYLLIGIVNYWIIHTSIHFYPKILPKFIVNHHLNHHNKNGNRNYAVSNPFIDYIFKTELVE